VPSEPKPKMIAVRVLTLLLVLEITARPFASARFGLTVSQLGRAVSADVRLVATEKMLRCMEVRGCKPTLLAMVTRMAREKRVCIDATVV
jgi:hypothetical protein